MKQVNFEKLELKSLSGRTETADVREFGAGVCGRDDICAHGRIAEQTAGGEDFQKHRRVRIGGRGCGRAAFHRGERRVLRKTERRIAGSDKRLRIKRAAVPSRLGCPPINL